MAYTCVIWRITDGKRGHERQSQGLAQALAQLLAVKVVDIPRIGAMTAAWQWLRGKFSPGEGLEAPDVILGAGHGTHLTMLAARRARGGRTVVLMQPSLPLAWFDLCLIPQHDGVAGANVIETMGALNPIQPASRKASDLGLMLIGGVSAHYRWNDDAVLDQVRQVATKSGGVKWLLTTSPRTPDSLLRQVHDLNLSNLVVVPFAAAAPDWLPEQLQRAAQVWVTPDSVSMVYEALTSGAAVGVFDLESVESSRVARGVQRLQQQGLIRGYAAWRSGQPLPVRHEEFNEAARCARWIQQTWFPDR